MLNRVKKSVPVFAAMAAFGIPLLTPTAAHAKFCGERAKLMKVLDKKYSEKSLGVGVSGTGTSVMEVLTSEKGTWTILMTTAKGKTCVMAVGHSWEETDKLALLPKT